MRAIVADDPVFLREGVTRLLEKAGFDVVGDAADRAELMRNARAYKPDVAIIDIPHAPTHTDERLQAARAIREEMPGTNVAVLSAYVEEVYALLGRTPPASLPPQGPGLGGGSFAEAVRRVAEGGSTGPRVRLAPALGADERTNRSRSSRRASMTGLMAEGRSNQAIGDALLLGSRGGEARGRHLHQAHVPPAPEDHRRVLAVLAFLRS